MMSDPVQNRSTSDSLLHSDNILRVLGGDAMQILRCGICMEFFDVPIVLPCGHTFCLHCLTEMCRHASRNSVLSPLKDLRIGCPNCRVLIYALPILERNVTCNFIIQSLLECLRARKCGKKKTQGVNTEEVCLSGKVRVLSDVELSRVTGEVDRLLTTLDSHSLLDNASLEVEEIRRQYIAEQEASQRQEEQIAARKILMNTNSNKGTRSHNAIFPVGQKQPLQSLQSQSLQPQSLQPNPFGFFGLEALNSSLLTLTAPPGFPQGPPLLHTGPLSQSAMQQTPQLQLHQNQFQQQTLTTVHHQQNHHQHQLTFNPHHHHSNEQQQQQQQQQQQHQHQQQQHQHHQHHQQQYNKMLSHCWPKASKTAAVLPVKRLVDAANGSGQTATGRQDQLDHDPAVMSYSVNAKPEGLDSRPS